MNTESVARTELEKRVELLERDLECAKQESRAQSGRAASLQQQLDSGGGRNSGSSGGGGGHSGVDGYDAEEVASFDIMALKAKAIQLVERLRQEKTARLKAEREMQKVAGKVRPGVADLPLGLYFLENVVRDVDVNVFCRRARCPPNVQRTFIHSATRGFHTPLSNYHRPFAYVQVQVLSDHIEKLMLFLKHEATQKAKAHEQQRRLQKELDLVKVNCYFPLRLSRDPPGIAPPCAIIATNPLKKWFASLSLLIAQTSRPKLYYLREPRLVTKSRHI